MENAHRARLITNHTPRFLLLMLIAAVALTASPVRAQMVLEIPPSARASGMGLAFVALAGGADATWWNPAALAFADWSHSATWTYRQIDFLAPDAFGYIFGAYGTQIGSVGTMAVDLSYIREGTYLVTDSSGQLLGEFAPYSMAPAFAYGGKATDDLALGVSFKVVHSRYLPDEAARPGRNSAATSAALDGGFLWSSQGATARVGFVVRNLGPGLEWAEGESDPLPRSLQAGVAYWLISEARHDLVLAGDLDKPIVHWDDGPKLRLGTEYLFRDTLALRFGWVYEGWYQEYDAINDPTWGLGIRLDWFSFDYATAPQDGESRYWLITFGASF